MSKHALPYDSDDAAHKDSGANHERVLACGRLLLALREFMLGREFSGDAPYRNLSLTGDHARVVMRPAGFWWIFFWIWFHRVDEWIRVW